MREAIVVRVARERALLELFLGISACVLGAWLTLPKPPGALISPPRAHARSDDEAQAPPLLTTSYTLSATLDAIAHRIKANGRIEFVNRARAPVTSLFFHLYLNAFKNDRSVFLRSPFGAGRGGAHAHEFGYIDVNSLRAHELADLDLWPNRVRHSPSDPEDETDIEVPLPKPLAPGATLTLLVDFTSQLPEIVERTGYVGSFHFAGQWFPKLAKLEADGSFAHFSFHPQAEFYADFGRYDVTLDVPRSFVVGASGVQTEEKVLGERKRVRYVAEPVHDFAWTAWDGFVETHARIGAVDVKLLLPPGNVANEKQTESALAFALPYFSARFGSYPYSTLTVVHPPRGAEAAGGMEYPTLITTGAPWYSPYSGVRGLEAVTIHELGHQWFYGLLASNEARFPFLDEGLNSYAELLALNARFGQSSAFSALGLNIADESLFRAFSAARAQDENVGDAAHSFSSFRNLAALVYSRTATLLATLERVWGRDKSERAFHVYAERYRFRQPTPAEFLAVVREEVAPEAAEMLDDALFHRGSVNYLVREVQNARQSAPAGFFDRASGRERVPQIASTLSGYRGRVTVYRHGSLEIPVDVLLISEDQRRTLEHWDGRGAFHTFEYAGPTPLAYAVVDPENKILIDDDLMDNAASASAHALPRTHERLAYFAALALGGCAP